MRRRAASVIVVIGSLALLACTFTRPLGYLTEGDPADGGAPTDGGGSSSGTPLDGDAGDIAGTLLAGAQLNPKYLLQDADNLYWFTDDSRIMQLPKAGGSPREVTKLAIASPDSLFAIALDPSPGGKFYLSIDGAVKAMPREGGALVDLLPGPNAVRVAADESYLFVLGTDDVDVPTLTRYPKGNVSSGVVLSKVGSGDTGTGALALFGDGVYWSTTDPEAVQILYELPKAATAAAAPKVWKNTGRNIDKVAAGVNVLESYQLAIDADGIYWIDSSYGLPYHMTRSQMVGEAPALLTSQNGVAAAITVDAKNIWVLYDERVIRIGKQDNSRVQLRTPTTATEIVSDDRAVYYLFLGTDDIKPTGGVYRIDK